MNTKHLATLADILGTYINVDGDDLDRLSAWVKNPDLPPAGLMAVNEFKNELRVALDTPNAVTTALYNKWTQLEIETQDEVRSELQRVWDACFG
jgi:hypothetical protein